MKVGTILHHRYFNGVADHQLSLKYQDHAIKLFKHFGMFATGMLKAIAPTYPKNEDDYDWKNVDLLVDFASRNTLSIHYNTVITGHLDAFPDWYKMLDQAEKYAFLERHVRTVVGRYKDRVEFFKLVNEATKEGEQNYLGTGKNKVDIIGDIFKWAVEEYPEGQYMINEYGTLIRDEVRSSFIELVENIKAKGARVDLIGLQGHMGYYPDPFQLPQQEYLSKALDEIHSVTCCSIHITEFDLSYNNAPLDPYPGSSIDPGKKFEAENRKFETWYAYQAYAYKNMIELCRNKSFIEAFYFWIFADDRAINWERPECGLLDEEMKIKPKYKIF